MQLKKIAYKMRRFADVNPRKEGQPFDPARYRVELGGGLRIVLYVDEERHWHLIAYRQGTFPGEVEMETVRRDFEVPEPNQESREIVPDGKPSPLATPVKSPKPPATSMTPKLASFYYWRRVTSGFGYRSTSLSQIKSVYSAVGKKPISPSRSGSWPTSARPRPPWLNSNLRSICLAPSNRWPESRPTWARPTVSCNCAGSQMWSDSPKARPP